MPIASRPARVMTRTHGLAVLVLTPDWHAGLGSDLPHQLAVNVRQHGLSHPQDPAKALGAQRGKGERASAPLRVTPSNALLREEVHQT